MNDKYLVCGFKSTKDTKEAERERERNAHIVNTHTHTHAIIYAKI